MQLQALKHASYDVDLSHMPLKMMGHGVGPLQTAVWNLRSVVVAVEYFIKWIDAKALLTITSTSIKKVDHVTSYMPLQFPRALTVDKGTQLSVDTGVFIDISIQLGGQPILRFC